MLRIDRSVTPDDGQDAHPRHLGARPAPEHRERRPPRSHPVRDPRPDRPGARLGLGRRRRAGRELRRRRPEEPAARPALAALRHHPPADPRRLPLLRRRPGRLRRGHPHRRRHQERAVPPLAVPQLPDAVGPDERRGLPELRLVQLRTRHQGLGQPGRPQPRPRPARARPGRRSWTTSWSGSRRMRHPDWRDSPS